MGNEVRFLCGNCQRSAVVDEPQILGSHAVIIEIIGVAALIVDLFHFGIISQYNKLFKVWNEDRPPPKQPEVAIKLVNQTLYRISCFLWPYVPQTFEEDIVVTIIWHEGITPPWLEGLQFELLTQSVNKGAIVDGDGFTAYINITELSELKLMPRKVIHAVIMKENTCHANDFKLEKLIKKMKMILGKYLKIHVYDEDIYGQSVGDWHKEARNACRGLWALVDLEKPWE
ncbi:hypothetical protein KFK09_026324 [Dendrobium nobile]|uniref:Uncharacterized protein n=1 Tax=Dendrobium nobile TaxID=94219 RepID=A0A8T3A7M0_DENNO|nr:hypothetical protein KFK09_026324 [Dendrobium nobile]